MARWGSMVVNLEEDEIWRFRERVVSYGKFPVWNISIAFSRGRSRVVTYQLWNSHQSDCRRGSQHSYESDECLDTIDLLSVVDFPEDGLPTRPMSGSRGMLFEHHTREYQSGFGNRSSPAALSIAASRSALEQVPRGYST